MKIKLFNAVINPMCLHQITESELSECKEIEVSLKNFSLNSFNASLEIENINFNYAYVKDLNRWYYLNVESVNNNLVNFRFNLDVLATYEKTIYNNVVIERDQCIDGSIVYAHIYDSNMFIPDSSVYKYMPKEVIQNEPPLTLSDIQSIESELSNKMLDMTVYTDDFNFNCDILNPTE